MELLFWTSLTFTLYTYAGYPLLLGVWARLVTSRRAKVADRPGSTARRKLPRVSVIIAARDALRAKGATILGTGEPRIGAHGTPIIFVHPKDMGGVLVELMATPKGEGH